jgi:hypothetical protein
LVQRVQTAARAALGARDVLVFPPPVEEPQLGEAAQRPVHGDLLDTQAVRNLQPVELGSAFSMDAQSFEEHRCIELEQESTSRTRHVTPAVVGSSPPRN